MEELWINQRFVWTSAGFVLMISGSQSQEPKEGTTQMKMVPSDPPNSPSTNRLARSRHGIRLSVTLFALLPAPVITRPGSALHDASATQSDRSQNLDTAFNSPATIMTLQP